MFRLFPKSLLWRACPGYPGDLGRLLSFLHTPSPLPSPSFLLHALLSLLPIFVYCRDHCLLPRSKIHPNLFHQNHTALFLRSILNLYPVKSFPAISPALHTYLQTAAAVHHWFFFLFSTSCFDRCWCFHCPLGQTSSGLATTSG